MLRNVIVPMLAAYYAIRHYGLLVKQVNDDELILDSKRRRSIYDALSYM
jgi:hypothetical protein